MTPAANTRHTLWGRLWRYALLVAVALIFIFPVVFMVVSSLKPDDQLLRDTASLRAFLPVGDISLDNYFAAFRRAYSRLVSTSAAPPSLVAQIWSRRSGSLTIGLASTSSTV